MSFTIGADPELICRLSGKFVPAYNYFKANSSFGLDGCEATAEIRPGYSESPLEIISGFLGNLLSLQDIFPRKGIHFCKVSFKLLIRQSAPIYFLSHFNLNKIQE